MFTQSVAAYGAIAGTASFANIVPDGYRLIIEHVSLHGRTPVGQRLWGVIHPCDNLKGSPSGTTPLLTTSFVEDSTSTNALHEGIACTSGSPTPRSTPTPAA